MSSLLSFHVLTTFPDLFQSFLSMGVIGQAVQAGKIQVQIINIRDFTEDRHRTTDDRPFGGGDGMVMKYQPLAKALDSVIDPGLILAMSPQGQLWNHEVAEQLAIGEMGSVYRSHLEPGINLRNITIVCGRYGGIDERFLQSHVHHEFSIGDYVLSGGEIPAMVLIDSICRFLPGVLGNPESAQKDSLTGGGLEGGVWTRPEHLSGLSVPSVLIGGHHADIAKFRTICSWIRTWERRPDLLPAFENQLNQSHELEKILDEVRSFSLKSDAELRAAGVDNPMRLRQFFESKGS